MNFIFPAPVRVLTDRAGLLYGVTRPFGGAGVARPNGPLHCWSENTISLEESAMGNNDWGNQSTKIWIGIAIGAAVGLGIALSRRRPATRWDSAREFGRRMADRSEDLADASRDLMQRVRVIYEEGRKVVEDAGELWAHGRKLVAR